MAVSAFNQRASNATNVSAESRVQSTGRADLLLATDRISVMEANAYLLATTLEQFPQSLMHLKRSSCWRSISRPASRGTDASQARKAEEAAQRADADRGHQGRAGGLRSEFARDLTGETPRRAQPDVPICI